MDNAETNRKVAEALGYVVIPAAKADCHTHAQGVTYLYSASDGEKVRLFRTVWVSPSGRNKVPNDEFSPATDASDALEALEAFHDLLGADGLVSRLEYDGDRWCVLLAVPKQPEHYGKSLSEAICQAIIAAEAKP